jgi:hypothetical protein
MATSKKPAFYAMSTAELSSWVNQHNNDMFDCEPTIEGVDDDDLAQVRAELEDMAEVIWNAQA